MMWQFPQSGNSHFYKMDKFAVEIEKGCGNSLNRVILISTKIKEFEKFLQENVAIPLIG